MKIQSTQSGFTLIELVIAVSISSVVLIGLLGIASSMVQFEVESARNGSVTAGTMASITSMNRDMRWGGDEASGSERGGEMSRLFFRRANRAIGRSGVF